jgi:hypothetical protein
MPAASAVVTTGIYCRPACPAQPRAEHARSFPLAAVGRGRRPVLDGFADNGEVMLTNADTGNGDPGVVTGLSLLLLRSEGIALLAMATALPGGFGRSWWLFVALLAVPDLGLLGYFVGSRMGALADDLTHTYVPVAALGVVGLLSGSSLAVSVARIWFAHIGMDRTRGLGLRYPDRPGHTHRDG